MKENGTLMTVKYFVDTDINGNKIEAWYNEVWKRVDVASSYPGDVFR